MAESIATLECMRTSLASHTILQVAGSIGIIMKEKQLSALISFCEGNDIFVTLPTGYGKSMIPDNAIRLRWKSFTVFMD